MPNLVRIGPTVWISIPDTHTHTQTHTPGFNFIYKIMLIVIMMRVVMLKADILSVIMLSVVAPFYVTIAGGQLEAK
jgi:hypothetical protein